MLQSGEAGCSIFRFAVSQLDHEKFGFFCQQRVDQCIQFLQIDANRFRLQIVLQRGVAHFAAPAGLLVAAER